MAKWNWRSSHGLIKSQKSPGAAQKRDVAWASWMPCRRMSLSAQSLKLEQAVDVMEWLLGAVIFYELDCNKTKIKKKSKSHPSHEIICSALEWCRSMQNCALYSLPASSHKRSKINCAVSFTSHACQPPPLPPSGRRTPKVNSSHESKLNKLIK